MDREWKLPLCRSYLYVPATKPELLDKALASEADAVIVDLDDGVAPDRKVEARESLAEQLPGPRDKPVFVRVNALQTDFAELDLECAAHLPVTGIRIPKVRSANELARACDRLRELGFAGGLQAIIENAEGVVNMREIATADPMVEMMSLGEGDLPSDLGCSPEHLGPIRLDIVVVSRATGLRRPIQAGHPFTSESRQPDWTALDGKQAGYFGRIAVHPAQVPAINRDYTPCIHEVDFARDALGRLSEMISKGQSTTRDMHGRYLSLWYRAQGERILKEFELFGARDGCPTCT